jgi:hypothetical protein
VFLFLFREGSHRPETGSPAEAAKADHLTPSQGRPDVARADAVATPLVLSRTDDREACALQVVDGEAEQAESAERILSLALSPAVRSEERAAIEASWRAGDFARAAGLAAALSDPEDRRKVLVPLLEEWGRTDPKAAVQFAQGSPTGIERQELLEATIRAWSERDLVAASDWLNEFEPQPDYDLAVAAIANSEPLCLYQPETALSWAESITTSATRWEVTSFVVTLWAQRNPPAARLYIETSAVLTPEERTRMLTHVSHVVSWIE